MRITPLNLASSCLLVWALYQLSIHHSARTANPVYIVGIVVFLSVADQFFRLRLKNLRRIWIAEILFLIFAAVIMILIKKQ